MVNFGRIWRKHRALPLPRICVGVCRQTVKRKEYIEKKTTKIKKKKY